MKTNNDRIAKAMRLAEIAIEDKQDAMQCMDSLKRNAGLSDEEARIVTSSIRESIMPQEMRVEGFSDEDINKLITANVVDFAEEEEMDDEALKPSMVSEFANEEDEMDEDEAVEDLDMPEEDAEIEEPADDETSEELDEEMSEDDDETDETEFDAESDEPAELTVEVPANKLLALQQAIEDVFAEQDIDSLEESIEIGDDEDDEDFISLSEEEEAPLADEELGEEEDDYDIELSEEPVDEEIDGEDNDVREFNDVKQVLSIFEVDNMTKEVLAERKAAREALLAKSKQNLRTASDAEQETSGLAADPSTDAFDKAKVAQLHTQEMKFNKETLENSQGSELVNEAKWKPADIEVPTLNKRMESGGNMKPTTLDGTPEDKKDYVVEFDVFEVPTQMTEEEYGKTPTIPQTEGSAFSGHRGQVLAKAKSKKAKEEVDKEAENLKIEVESKKKMKKAFDEALVAERARMKTAYGCALKLVVASAIEVDEAEGIVDMWLDNNTTGKQMKVQTGVMLRSSGSKNRVVASNDAPSTRTASKNNSVSFGGYGSLSNPAVEDLREALSSVWSTPSKSEFESIFNKNLEDK